MEVPHFFFLPQQRMIYCSKLGDSNNSWGEVLFPPHCALSPPHCRLFIHHNHFAIVPSLPCSSCHLWFKRGGRSRESLHMWEDADPKYLCPFLAPICAKQRHRTGDAIASCLNMTKKVATARANSSSLSPPSPWLCSETSHCCYGYSKVAHGGFFRVASVTKGIKKLA